MDDLQREGEGERGGEERFKNEFQSARIINYTY